MKKLKIMAFLLAFLVTIPMFSIQGATENECLRIGLVTEFGQKSSLSIKDTKVKIGYSVGNVYKEVATITSKAGLDVKSATKFYGCSTITYGTYEEAAKAKALLESQKIQGYIGFFGYRKLKVVIGEYQTEALLEQDIKKLSQTLEMVSLGSDNGERIVINGGQDTIFCDGSGENGYVQFAPVGTVDQGVSPLTIGTKQYRGRLEIGRYKKSGVSAINIVPMDEYLYGVLPAEMVTSWHMEALKAQAVVSRTYALRKGKGFSSDSNITTPYILNDTTSSQVYKGYQREEKRTNQAVDETKGEYLYYGDQLVDATFFSTSGGATLNCEDVWGGVVPYLKSVPDIYELSPEKKPWIVTMTNSEIQKRIGTSVGTVTKIAEETRTPSGYLNSMIIYGSSKQSKLEKSKIRSFFGTPSTKFKIITSSSVPDQVTVLQANGKTSTKRIQNCNLLSSGGTKKAGDTTLEQYIVLGKDNLSNYPKQAPKSADTYYLAGMGYGHGVGMSQSGANGMANAGYSYEDIVKHYYTGVTLVKK